MLPLQPCLVVVDFNVEPTKIPCLSKGISAGLWVDLEAAWAWAHACGREAGATCKRTWGSAGGYRLDFMVGCPRAAAAAATGCHFRRIGGLYLIWLSGRTFSILGGYLRSLSVRLFGLPPGCLRKVWEIYDDRLQFMARDDALSLEGSLRGGVCHAHGVMVVCCGGCPC